MALAKFNRACWIQILVAALVAIVGVGFFTNKASVTRNGDALGLQRIDLLYLNEPAPSIDQFDIVGSKAVIVFCESCQLPKLDDAIVIRSSDAGIAKQYALLRANGRVGPGYAVIDSSGKVRYRSFDQAIHDHTREINRLVAGLE